MDFLELTKIQHSSESVYPANVVVSLIFVTRPINLVEVTESKPLDSDIWLQGHKLYEKIILSAGIRWAIDGCDQKLRIRVADIYVGGEKKFIGPHI